MDAVNVSFGDQLTDEQWKLDELILDHDRVLGAYDGDTLVGGGAAFSFRFTVPGGASVPTAGVTSVGVLPSHRRQGILRQLMARQLADVRQRGEPLAALFASEGSIYQRFGYGLGSLNGTVDVERERTSFRDPVAADGQVRLVDAATAESAVRVVYDAVRARTPGFFERSDAWWRVFMADPEFRRRGAGRKFHAILERDGQPVAYALYRIKQEWLDLGSASTLMVVELLAVDPAAYQQMWRYVFGVDLIAKIRARLGPPDHPLLLIVAEPRRLALRISDGLWLRVVDVPGALAARGYAADGSVVIEVSDEFMPEVAGRWRFTVKGGQGTAEATNEPAELALDITDLGAVYLGAFSFAQLASAGRTVEMVLGARARADSMFATELAPWCPEVF